MGTIYGDNEKSGKIGGDYFGLKLKLKK